MDQEVIREHAHAHGAAVVSGDLRTAAADLSGDARTKAAGVMQRLPDPLVSAEIESIESRGNGCTVRIAYHGADGKAVVQTSWEEREGRPRIVDLEVVS